MTYLHLGGTQQPQEYDGRETQSSDTSITIPSSKGK